ncbi:MAG: PH domain-containing protein [Actinomycetes bacterium]
MDESSTRAVYRSGLARGGSYVWFGVAALNLVDIALRGSGRSAWVALGLVLFATVVVYMVAFRPAVVVDERGVLVRNPFRDAEVPWHALTGVDSTDSLRLHTDGRVHRAWAVQAPNRARARAHRQMGLRSSSGPGPSDDVRTAMAGRTHVDYVADRIKETWGRAGPADEGSSGVTVRWFVPGMAALVAVTALLVGALVVE